MASRLSRNAIGLLMFFMVIETACAQAQSVKTTAGQVQVDDLADGLTHPWGMAFLPNGRPCFRTGRALPLSAA